MRKTRILHIIIFIAAMSALIAIGLAGAKVSASQDWPLKIWAQNENGSATTWRIVDEETGVNYVVMSYGSTMGGCAITQRLNADGSLFITD